MFKYTLEIILNPKMWMLLYPINLEWDKTLNDLMDKYNFEVIDYEKYYVKLHNKYIWIKNYPYAAFDECIMVDVFITDKSFQLFRMGTNCLPTRRTILKARDKLYLDTGIKLNG